MAYVQQRHFSAYMTSWCSRNNTQIFISIILFMDIINYVLYSDCLMLFCKFDVIL